MMTATQSPPPAALSSSYEEIVHAENAANAVETSSSSSCLEAILGTLAEWLLILQGVAEDRDMDMPQTCIKCRCQKAARITQDLSALQRIVVDAEQVYDRLGMLEESSIDELNGRLHEMAVMLRSDVSILIPTDSPVSVSQWRGVNPSRWILQSLNGGNGNSSFIMDELITVVTRLLGVDTCESCNNHFMSCFDEEMDQSSPAGDNLSLAADKSRKRKQRTPAKLNSQIFGTKSRRMDTEVQDELVKDDPMVEEAENGINILTLLEKKKKGLKKDGLYKFVLWREALKDEKSKASV